MTHLATIVETSHRVAETRARTKKIETMRGCLDRLEPGEVAPAVAFLSGSIRQGRIGIGYTAVRELRGGARADASTLTVLDVDRVLERVKHMSGTGSRSARQDVLAGLLRRATDDEQRFLHRLLIGELRQGALDGVMMDAVAKAAGVPASAVRRAVMLSGDLGAVATEALGRGAAGLADFTLELFRPVAPMLAQPAESIADAIARHGRALVEWKLDGARIQVHRSGDRVQVFTRRLNDVTAAVPEVVEAALELPAHEFVMDGEAIALRADGTPLPFQVTMRRFGRRADVDRLRVTIPIVPMLFDCLRMDGVDLIDRPVEDRLRVMSDVVPATLTIPRVITADADEADAFLDEALRLGHEGVMAKSLDAPYEAGSRGASWLKVKPAHTLDLVVLAAEWGSGRRRGWLSNLHLGARDPASGGFVMLGKTFKGMTDELLRWQTEQLQAIEVARDAYTVHVKPELVVEVAFDGVQTSPQYPGGLALRFARIKRYRADKSAAEADTIDAVRALHAAPH